MGGMSSYKQTSLFDFGLDLRPAQQVKTRIMAATLAVNTLRNYRSSWKSFQRWCSEAGGVSSLPATPATLIDHAAWCIAEKLRIQTIYLRLKAANHYHREHGLALPFDREVGQFMRNAVRDLCERPQGMAALTPEQLRKISRALKARQTVLDVRDRAVLLLCFALGWRRSELASLDLRDVRWVKEGILLWLGRSKTDQQGRGRVVAVQKGRRKLTCPLLALDAWLKIRGRWPGPLFTRITPGKQLTRDRMDDDSVRRAVKRGLSLIGENAEAFGAHSLRSGMITASLENGATETSVMQRTGHKRYDTLRRYVRPAQAFRSDPLKGVL
jgi:integrase